MLRNLLMFLPASLIFLLQNDENILQFPRISKPSLCSWLDSQESWQERSKTWLSSGDWSKVHNYCTESFNIFGGSLDISQAIHEWENFCWWQQVPTEQPALDWLKMILTTLKTKAVPYCPYKHNFGHLDPKLDLLRSSATSCVSNSGT